jgi:hypothetical protein
LISDAPAPRLPDPTYFPADGQFKILRLTSDTSFAAEFTAERDPAGSEQTKT